MHLFTHKRIDMGILLVNRSGFLLLQKFKKRIGRLETRVLSALLLFRFFPCANASSPVFHLVFADHPAVGRVEIDKTFCIHAVSALMAISLNLFQRGGCEALCARFLRSRWVEMGRVGKMGIVGKRGQHLTARHCKALDSDNAWQRQPTLMPDLSPVPIVSLVSLVPK